MQSFFSAFPKVRDWRNRMKHDVHQKGYVTTITNRRREVRAGPHTRLRMAVFFLGRMGGQGTAVWRGAKAGSLPPRRPRGAGRGGGEEEESCTERKSL